MRLGSLDRLLSLYAPSDSRDAFGQPVAEMKYVGKEWANVASKSGRARIESDALDEDARYSIVMRGRHDIRPGWQLRGTMNFRSVAWNVDSVIDHSDPRLLTVIASEVKHGS